jgi:hypothetical protein
MLNQIGAALGIPFDPFQSHHALGAGRHRKRGSAIEEFRIRVDLLRGIRMLGEMFRHQVPARTPRDLKHRTLRLDQYEELRRYFTEETELGKKEARMRTALSSRPPQAGA